MGCESFFIGYVTITLYALNSEHQEARLLVLSRKPNPQAAIPKALEPLGTISEVFAYVAEKLNPNENAWADLSRQLVKAAPWLAVLGDPTFGLATAGIAYGLNKVSDWLAAKDAESLAAIACTTAYQSAAHAAINQHLTSALAYQATRHTAQRVASNIRDLPPAEQVDFTTFDFDVALVHPFTRRADDLLLTLLRGAAVPADEEARIFNTLHERFKRELDGLLTHKDTQDKFAPFADRMKLNRAKEARAVQALQIHAEYQAAQYLSRPLFQGESYALQHIYADTDCACLPFKDYQDLAQPDGARELKASDFADQTRYDLLKKVEEYLLDETFDDLLVVQGLAGAGKSSFTLRLCHELLAGGFIPVRVQMKKLKLTDNLYVAIGDALELEDKERRKLLPYFNQQEMLTDTLLRTPFGSTTIARYETVGTNSN